LFYKNQLDKVRVLRMKKQIGSNLFQKKEKEDKKSGRATKKYILGNETINALHVLSNPD